MVSLEDRMRENRRVLAEMEAIEQRCRALADRVEAHPTAEEMEQAVVERCDEAISNHTRSVREAAKAELDALAESSVRAFEVHLDRIHRAQVRAHYVLSAAAGALAAGLVVFLASLLI
ncbi:MAG: hypothetical protein OXG74_11785 [Acidobacteria bacterium]|nr:hypothetical protein [Acidobacteriota bacterium]